MSSYWDKILLDLKESGIKTLEELVITCFNLCEKYTNELAPCMAKCHDRFNLSMPYSLEVV